MDTYFRKGLNKLEKVGGAISGNRPANGVRSSSRLSHNDQHQPEGNRNSGRQIFSFNQNQRNKDNPRRTETSSDTSNPTQLYGEPTDDGRASASTRSRADDPFRDGDDDNLLLVNGASELDSVSTVATVMPNPDQSRRQPTLPLNRPVQTTSTRPESAGPSQLYELESTPRNPASGQTTTRENYPRDNPLNQIKNALLPSSPISNDQRPLVSAQSSSPADKQLASVAKQILKSGDGTGLRQKDIEHDIRVEGVDGALANLLTAYHDLVKDIYGHIHDVAVRLNQEKAFNSTLGRRDIPAAVEVLAKRYKQLVEEYRTLHQNVLDASKRIVGEKEYNSSFARIGPNEMLDRLAELSRQFSVAHKKLERVDERLQDATRGFTKRDIEYAYKHDGGVEGVLELMIRDYEYKIAESKQLRYLEDQIGAVLSKVPGKKREFESVLAREGSQGVWRLLMQHYHPFVKSDQELTRVETELKKASRGSLSAGDFDNVRDKKGVEGALQLVLNHFQGTAKDLKGKVDELQKSHKSVNSQNKKLDDENYELKLTQSRHKAAMDDLRRIHTEKIGALEREWDKKLRNAQREHDDELKRKEASYLADAKRLEADLRLAKADHKEEMARLRGAMESLDHEHQKERDLLLEDAERREKEARQAETKKAEVLREKYEGLKGVLVARQHTKGMSDPEIISSFRRLEGELDSFSRLEWEKKKESHWPFPENTLKRSENQRRVKQHIVQSSIWIILNEKIFCSPFEIFGDDGRVWHREWTGKFGQDTRSDFPNWPEATEPSESWRVDQVKECLDALKNPDSEAKKRMKRAHDECVGTIVDDIYDAVDEIAAVSESDRQVVEDFVKMAAQFWLNVSALNCRIMLYFPADGTKVLGTRKSATKLKLVVKPEVRRRGNAQGVRLDREQVLKGCEGESSEFQPR